MHGGRSSRIIGAQFSPSGKMMIWGKVRGVSGFLPVSLYKRSSYKRYEWQINLSSIFQEVKRHKFFVSRYPGTISHTFLGSAFMFVQFDLFIKYWNITMPLARSASVSPAACFFKCNTPGKMLKIPLL
jgi:hypothetical protein